MTALKVEKGTVKELAERLSKWADGCALSVDYGTSEMGDLRAIISDLESLGAERGGKGVKLEPGELGALMGLFWFYIENAHPSKAQLRMLKRLADKLSLMALTKERIA